MSIIIRYIQFKMEAHGIKVLQKNLMHGYYLFLRH